MNPRFVSLCLFSMLVSVTASAFPPEASAVGSGRIIDPSHMILKLDCTSCPSYNKTWNSTTSSLIYDLTIQKPTPYPPIHLNTGPFYPPGRQLGFTPFTRQTVILIPFTDTLDSYFASPSNYPVTETAAIIETAPVTNPYGWNITAIRCISWGYGDYEDVKRDIPSASVYLHTPANATTWRFVWWTMEPMTHADNFTDLEAPVLPKGLESILLATNGARESHGLSLPWTLLIVAVVVSVVTGFAAWVSTKYDKGQERGTYRKVAKDEALESYDDEGGEMIDFRRSVNA